MKCFLLCVCVCVCGEIRKNVKIFVLKKCLIWSYDILNTNARVFWYVCLR